VVTVAGGRDARTALSAGYMPVPRAGLLLTTGPRRALALDPTELAACDLRLGDLEVF
jgi:hypothetical protein